MSKTNVTAYDIERGSCGREGDMIVIATHDGALKVTLWGAIDSETERKFDLTPEVRSAIAVRLERYIEKAEAERQEKARQAAYAKTAEKTGLTVYAVELLEGLFVEINSKLDAANDRIATLESQIASA